MKKQLKDYFQGLLKRMMQSENPDERESLLKEMKALREAFPEMAEAFID